MSALPYSRKLNEKEARERLRAWWAGSSLGRPALYVRARNPAFKPQDNPGAALDPKARDTDLACHLHRLENALEGNLWLAEAMPEVPLHVGANITLPGVLAGGDYSSDPATGTSWLKHLDDVYGRPLPVFDPNHPVLKHLDPIYDAMTTALDHRGFINPPSILDGLTTLSSFRGPDNLCLDLLEDAEHVIAWSAALTQIALKMYDHFYQRSRARGYRDSSSWVGATAEGTMDAVQCDFAVMMSPEMFDRFAMPDLRTMCDYFDYSLYHLDGTAQTRFLPSLRQIRKLNGIQWNPEPGAGSPSLPKWIEVFREIRKMGFINEIFIKTVEEAEILTRELGPDGLLIVFPVFDQVADAERAIERVRKAVR